MQTLYTKMSRERDPKFQQMTKIYIENGDRKVCKSSLTKEGQQHIDIMYKNYTYFQSKEKNALCPTEYKQNNLIFDYLSGESLCSRLLKYIELENRDAFIGQLYKFKQYVYDFGDEKELFSFSNEYKTVFGDVIPRQTVGAKHLNIDLIFENLIDLNNKFVAIDYEWIFGFVLPYEFVFYRAIFSFFIRYSRNIGDFIDINTVYDLFGITKEDIEIFQRMDQSFLSYVNGVENNYDNMLLNYKKESYDVKELIRKKVLHTELYYDLGNGFQSNLCIKKEVEIHQDDIINVCFQVPKSVSRVRFDPSMDFLCIYIDNIKIINIDGEEIEYDNYQSNAEYEIGKYFIFEHNDAQLILENLERIDMIEFTFRFITDDLIVMKEIINNYNINMQLEISNTVARYEQQLEAEIKERDRMNRELEFITSKCNRIEKMNRIYLEMITNLKSELYKK